VKDVHVRNGKRRHFCKSNHLLKENGEQLVIVALFVGYWIDGQRIAKGVFLFICHGSTIETRDHPSHVLPPSFWSLLSTWAIYEF